MLHVPTGSRLLQQLPSLLCSLLRLSPAATTSGGEAAGKAAGRWGVTASPSSTDDSTDFARAAAPLAHGCVLQGRHAASGSSLEARLTLGVGSAEIRLSAAGGGAEAVCTDGPA